MHEIVRVSFSLLCALVAPLYVDSMSKIIAQLLAYKYSSRSTELDPKSVPRGVILLGSFSAESWAAYARVNAKIATKMCRAKGELKAQLASLRTKGSHLIDETPAEGPIYLEDPWPNEWVRPSAEATNGGDGSGAWANWKSKTSLAKSSRCSTVLRSEYANPLVGFDGMQSWSVAGNGVT